jgi:ABC-2 type transport system ATP-binding protein
MVKISHLSKQFHGKSALSDFSYTFDYGVYGLLGPNGAGKTTLLRCILGLYQTKKGMIETDIQPEKHGQDYMGYLPQKSSVLPALTVKEQLMYFANIKGMPKREWEDEISRVLKLLHLEEYQNKKGRQLSGGMIRRVGIAQALLNHPSLIVLDEPTTGLDPEERMNFKNIIKGLRKECTILLSTHIVEDVEAVCDEVLILNQGKLLAYGGQEDISKIAAGKVYELSKSQVAEADYIEKELEVDGEVIYRVLTPREIPDIHAVCPNIEDGYLCAIKGI